MNFLKKYANYFGWFFLFLVNSANSPAIKSDKSNLLILFLVWCIVTFLISGLIWYIFKLRNKRKNFSKILVWVSLIYFLTLGGGALRNLGYG
tara:strand:+ start:167 stop:442 length:276 start_codon:yes stop_codon:yes gene_type:complete